MKPVHTDRKLQFFYFIDAHGKIVVAQLHIDATTGFQSHQLILSCLYKCSSLRSSVSGFPPHLAPGCRDLLPKTATASVGSIMDVGRDGVGPERWKHSGSHKYPNAKVKKKQARVGELLTAKHRLVGGN